MPEKKEEVPLGAHALIASMLNAGELVVWMFWYRDRQGNQEQIETLHLTYEAAIEAAADWIEGDCGIRCEADYSAINHWFESHPLYNGGVMSIVVELKIP